MSLALGLGVIVPSLVVFAALTRPWGRDRDRLSRALSASLAPGLGLGLASCTYFMLLLWLGDHARAVRADATLWGSCLILVLLDAYRRKKPIASVERSSDGRVAGYARRDRAALIAAVVGGLVIAVVAGASVWLQLVLNPHGAWDAWAIWNLRARSILRAVPDWSAVFANDLAWSHPDYPLLVPISVARLWAYSGAEGTAAPAFVAVLFLATSAATLVVSVGQLRGWPTGLLGGLALLMPATYVLGGPYLCADVPLGFFMLAAVSLAACGRHVGRAAPVYLVTAGLASGLAAWTKHEGALLFPLLVILLTAFPGMRSRRAALGVLVGAALPLLALIVFKLRYSPASYLFAQQSAAAIGEKLIDLARWTDVGNRLTALMPSWGRVPGGALLVLALAVCVTAGVDRRSAGRAGFALLVVMAMVLGYAAVYVITPLDVRWQIVTSFERLLMQLWPTTVWAAFQLSGSDSARVNPATSEPAPTP